MRIEVCSASAVFGIPNWSKEPPVRIHSNWEELKTTVSAVCRCVKSGGARAKRACHTCVP